VSGHSWPARYEIRVDAVLDERWTEWFGLGLLNEGDDTVLVGMIADQSALHGVLDKVRDMGLSVIDMRRLPAGGEEGRPG
jgi:hypothetical protein